MTINEVINKYPRVRVVLFEAGFRDLNLILSVDVDRKKTKHNLYFFGDRFYDSNVIEITILVKENKLKIFTADEFKTVSFSWDEEI